jgi:hypothetical protein
LLISALCGAFVVALLAAGCEPEPSPEPPPPPATNPEKLAPLVRTNSYYRMVSDSEETGLAPDESFWVDSRRSRRTTVAATLIELGAALRDGKVVDAAGEELFFAEAYDYEPNDGSFLRALREAEKKYHVVRMYGPPQPRNPVLLSKQLRIGLNRFGLSLDDDFWFEVQGRRRPTIVRTVLYDLGARLVNGKVVDAAGKELCFFYLHRGRGPSTRDWIDKQERELEELEKKYHVIRMYPPPRID